MNYKAIHIKAKNKPETIKEIIIAELDNIGFEGFLETDDGVVAYIREDKFNLDNIRQFYFMNNPEFGEIKIEEEFILEKNWNELWEKNYPPAVINNDVIIRAPFHPCIKKYKYEILIEPKMSFGTGHHETTSLMIELMFTIPFQDKIVLDMGCGTGVLGILASMLGAKQVTAVDINQWAYDNTIENIQRNKINNMQVLFGDSNLIIDKTFDIILANITKDVLLEDMHVYTKTLVKGGELLISGILRKDIEDIKQVAAKLDLKFHDLMQKKDWIIMKFNKN
jgi:ribosomal protein L11 methyltransferase